MKPCFVKVLETNLPAEILDNLLAFHAATVCDTTSQFTSIRKKTAWQVFRQYPHLLNKPGEHEIPSGAAVSEVEEFMCTLYELKSTTKSIQMVQCNIFRRLQTKIDSISPRRDALTQHFKRAHYQTKVWKQSLTSEPDPPSPTDWGWNLVDRTFIPMYLTSEPLQSNYVELTVCGYKESGNQHSTWHCATWVKQRLFSGNRNYLARN